MIPRLTELAGRGVPLVEVVCALMPGVSAEVACEVVNRLSNDLVAYSHGLSSRRFGRSMTVQMDPNAASRLGMVIARVPLNTENLTVGYKWECYCFGQLEALSGKIIDRIDVSLPGSFDDAQPWP